MSTTPFLVIILVSELMGEIIAQEVLDAVLQHVADDQDDARCEGNDGSNEDDNFR